MKLLRLNIQCGKKTGRAFFSIFDVTEVDKTEAFSCTIELNGLSVMGGTACLSSDRRFGSVVIDISVFKRLRPTCCLYFLKTLFNSNIHII